ncbi:hypothetical protein I308_105411 [Cryptococcus tetragattii IND107]|uniref:Uncharacterized protein n=1 Tax=Cryptococcus tetragattii IND107 TaxID=1296105 RepID=A0ABR3BKW6_9TREE
MIRGSAVLNERRDDDEGFETKYTSTHRYASDSPSYVPHTSNKFRNRFSYLESCYTSTNRAIIPHRNNLKSIWYLVFL